MLIASLILAATLAGESQSDDVPPREREILMELFAATDGAHWTDNAGWGTDRPVCDWKGVFCGGIDFDPSRPIVVWLSLNMNNLRGTLPPSLAGLKHLQRFGVSANQLTGPSLRSC